MGLFCSVLSGFADGALTILYLVVGLWLLVTGTKVLGIIFIVFGLYRCSK
ncbi:MAG: hypothetical protein U0411_01240 [Thermodesulfovibrionales bacterium]